MNDSVVLTVLLPVRNETMNLRIMLRILRSVLTMPHEIVVIFDSEADTSIAVVEEVRCSTRSGAAWRGQSAPGCRPHAVSAS
jgi:hypothetical protein